MYACVFDYTRSRYPTTTGMQTFIDQKFESISRKHKKNP